MAPSPYGGWGGLACSETGVEPEFNPMLWRIVVAGDLPPGHVEGEGKRLPITRLGEAPAKAVIPAGAVSPLPQRLSCPWSLQRRWPPPWRPPCR